VSERVRPSRRRTNPVEAIREAAAHGAQLVRLELELRLLELRRKAIELGVGAALALGALVIAPLLVASLLAAAGAALATTMRDWIAILIVSAVLLALVAGLAGGAIALTSAALKRGSSADG
jgi:hypothetical protein